MIYYLKIDESDNIMSKKSTSAAIARLIYSAMFLALAILLPTLTSYIPQIGRSILPMHLPVILSGFVCGPVWGMAVGIAAPLLRCAMTNGIAPSFPNAIAMAFELAVYAFIAGMLYKKLDKNMFMFYVELITAMVCGRLVWAIVTCILILTGIGSGTISFGFVWTSTVLSSIPGIVLQLIVIPLTVNVFKKNKLILN